MVTFTLIHFLKKNFPTDGINEEGLVMGALYFPLFGSYQIVPPGQNSNAIAVSKLGLFILGCFKSVDDIKTSLPNFFVWDDISADLHWGIYDSTGKGIVIEYENHTLSIFDNNVETLTNSPGFVWQSINLQRYLYLSIYDPNPVTYKGVVFQPMGVGYGMIGLPGDWSSPSRFVRIFWQKALLANHSLPPDAPGILNAAQHVINNVDIVKGITVDGKYFEYTQYVAFLDITNLIFYWRTYDNLVLQSVAMSSVNIQQGAPMCRTDLTGTTLKCGDFDSKKKSKKSKEDL